MTSLHTTKTLLQHILIALYWALNEITIKKMASCFLLLLTSVGEFPKLIAIFVKNEMKTGTLKVKMYKCIRQYSGLRTDVTVLCYLRNQ